MDDPSHLGPAGRTSPDNGGHLERDGEARLAALRAAVQRGFDDVAAGRVVGLEEGIEQLVRGIREKAAGARK
jgi:hypothetical protein